MARNYSSPGAIVEEQLFTHLAALTQLTQGGPPIPTIANVTKGGALMNGLTFSGFLDELGTILVDSGQVFLKDGSVVRRYDETNMLALLSSGLAALPAAASLLSDLVNGEFISDERTCTFLLPGELIQAALANPKLRKRLPVIRFYARRPAFDENWRFCGRGYHRESAVLVHGSDVIPTAYEPSSAGNGVRDRLPQGLRSVLEDFCFHRDADMVNCLGVLLTGVLINHFVDAPHPIVLIDGNRPEIGKSLLVQVCGRLLDGKDPTQIRYTQDDELDKRVGALLLEQESSVIFIDNVRGQIDSPFLESNSLAPKVSTRILGKSERITQANTYLWAITANGTKTTPDLISRAVPIRLHYEGNPRQRTLPSDLLERVLHQRDRILGELVGMVEHWRNQGASRSNHRHRCRQWAQVIGGILESVGLGSPFLTNLEEAGESMDLRSGQLRQLAEWVVRHDHRLWAESGDDRAGKGDTAGNWTQALQTNQILLPADRTNTQAAATQAGSFLSASVGIPFDFDRDDKTYRATLEVQERRSRRKYYWFTVEPAGDPGDESIPAPPEHLEEPDKTDPVREISTTLSNPETENNLDW